MTCLIQISVQYVCTLFLLRAIATLATFPKGVAICTKSCSLVSGGTPETSITFEGEV